MQQDGSTAADGGGREDAAARDASVDLDATMVQPGPDADVDDGGGSIDPPAPLIVSFDPPPGGFVAPTTITLTPVIDDAPIYYTLDGSLPTEASAQYSEPIVLNETTLLRVLSQNPSGNLVSVDALYLALDSEVSNFSSNLPVLVVHMLDGDVPSPLSREYVDGVFSVFERSKSSGRTKLAGASTLSSRIGIKVRGRSTRNQDKSSYTFEMRDAAGEDLSHPLLGMPAESDWVLYAPFNFDRSLVRNAFVYNVARSMGRYAPRTRFCEVFVQSAGLGLSQLSYRGVYVLTERLTRDANRIPITKLRDTDNSAPNVTGGYVFKNDEPDGDDPLEQFTVGSGRKFLYDYPKPAEITEAQSDYLIGYIDSVERATKASNGIDAMSGSSYDELIDVGSFIDANIVNLLSKNPDAFSLSEFFYKDRSGPLHAGPVWDFDLSMAAFDPFGDRSTEPKYWGANDFSFLFYGSFYNALLGHQEYRDLYWARWHELLDGEDALFTTDKFDAILDGYQVALTEAEARNRARWPQAAPKNDDLGEEIDVIKTWLATRLTWIKANLDVLPPQ